MTLTKNNNMEMAKKQDKGIEMICKKCSHEWTYTGKKTYPAWINCPSCHAMNRVRKVSDKE